MSKKNKFLLFFIFIYCIIISFFILFISPRDFWIYKYDGDQLYFSNILLFLQGKEIFNILHPGSWITNISWFFLKNYNLPLFSLAQNYHNLIKVLLHFVFFYSVILIFYKKNIFHNFFHQLFFLLIFLSLPNTLSALDNPYGDHFIFILSFIVFLFSIEILRSKKTIYLSIIWFNLFNIIFLNSKFSALPFFLLSNSAILLKLILFEDKKKILFFLITFIFFFVLIFYNIIEYLPFIVAKSFFSGEVNNFSFFSINSVTIKLILTILSCYLIYSKYILIKNIKIFQFSNNKIVIEKIYFFFSLFLCLFFTLNSNFAKLNYTQFFLEISDKSNNFIIYFPFLIYLISHKLSYFSDFKKRIFLIFFFIFIFFQALLFFDNRSNVILEGKLLNNQILSIKSNKIFVDDYVQIPNSYFYHSNTFSDYQSESYLTPKLNTYFLNLRTLMYKKIFIEKFLEKNYQLNYLKSVKGYKHFSENNLSKLKIKFCNVFKCIKSNYKFYEFKTNDFDDSVLVMSQNHIVSLLSHKDMSNEEIVTEYVEFFSRFYEIDLDLVKVIKLNYINNDVIYIYKKR